MQTKCTYTEMANILRPLSVQIITENLLGVADPVQNLTRKAIETWLVSELEKHAIDYDRGQVAIYVANPKVSAGQQGFGYHCLDMEAKRLLEAAWIETLQGRIGKLKEVEVIVKRQLWIGLTVNDRAYTTCNMEKLGKLAEQMGARQPDMYQQSQFWFALHQIALLDEEAPQISKWPEWIYGNNLVDNLSNFVRLERRMGNLQKCAQLQSQAGRVIPLIDGERMKQFAQQANPAVYDQDWFQHW